MKHLKTFLALVLGLSCVIVIVFATKKFTSRKKTSPTITIRYRTESPEVRRIIEITVRKGYSLSEITHDLGTDLKETAQLNKISNLDLILPGQKIKIRPFDKTDVVKVSWYGPGFHGKLMSNRKTFDMNNPTIVAHKWLPFGTKVRLTRRDNRKSIVVTVQDRGPYVKGRIFDLSRGAAELLDMIDEGITTCEVEIL